MLVKRPSSLQPQRVARAESAGNKSKFTARSITAVHTVSLVEHRSGHKSQTPSSLCNPYGQLGDSAVPQTASLREPIIS